MLHLFVLYCCFDIARRARTRGLSPTRYVLILLGHSYGGWILGELAGIAVEFLFTGELVPDGLGGLIGFPIGLILGMARAFRIIAAYPPITRPPPAQPVLLGGWGYDEPNDGPASDSPPFGTMPEEPHGPDQEPEPGGPPSGVTSPRART